LPRSTASMTSSPARRAAESDNLMEPPYLVKAFFV